MSELSNICDEILKLLDTRLIPSAATGNSNPLSLGFLVLDQRKLNWGNFFFFYFGGQAEKEFKVEVKAIGRVRHKNLVRLLGYCAEGAHRLWKPLMMHLLPKQHPLPKLNSLSKLNLLPLQLMLRHFHLNLMIKPRKKMRFLKFSFSEIHGDEVANEMVELVRDTMDRLYDDYSRADSPNVAEKFTGCSNEIEKYLAENCESRKDVKFEILGWWKANSDRYQVLSKMARDVLAVPISTIASELAFSTRGRILDPFRSSLSPLRVQNLIYAQN
nr:zinc finger bed domain-containing protein ricesleeper 3 [Quercus suber]